VNKDVARQAWPVMLAGRKPTLC